MDEARNERGRPINVGLLPPIIEGTMAGETARWADLLAIARRAEELGFDSLWVSDHLLFRLPGREEEPVGMWEGWTLLAALAAATSRIALGPSAMVMLVGGFGTWDRRSQRRVAR